MNATNNAKRIAISTQNLMHSDPVTGLFCCRGILNRICLCSKNENKKIQFKIYQNKILSLQFRQLNSKQK